MEMLQDEDAETAMLAIHVKWIVRYFLELNVNVTIAALEAIGISIDEQSVA